MNFIHAEDMIPAPPSSRPLLTAMFRIVENRDGSTSILDRLSGKLLTVIPAKSRPNKEAQNESQSSVLSPRSNSFNRIPLPPAPCARSTDKAAPPVGLPDGSRSETTAAMRSAPGSEPVRRLRPRNVQPEYNEDKAFEALIHPTNGVLSTTCAASDSEGPIRKPDHLVVVYKHSPERQAETPNRMRLLPAATLNKLQAGLHHPKTGPAEATGPDTSRFPVEPSEPENDCIDQSTFYQYLNLIPATTLTKKPVTELKQKWPLRHHSRTSPSTRSKNSLTSPGIRASAAKQLQSISPPVEPQSRSEVEKNIWFSGLKSKEKFVTSQKRPQNVLHLDPKGVLHLIPSGSADGIHHKQIHRKQSLSSSGSCEVRYPAHDQDLFCSLPTQPPSETMKSEQRKLLLKRFVKKYLLKPAEHYKPGIELSSPLGKRLLDAYSVIVNLQSRADVLRFIKSYERSCSTNHLNHRQLLQSLKGPFSPKVKVDFSLPTPSKTNCVTSRVLRSQLLVNPASNAWGLKSYHIYAFSKQERLEKSLTMTAGLDWKSRLLALHCDDIILDVHKITCCDVCRQPMSPDSGHSCGSANPLWETAPDAVHEETPVITLDDSFEDSCEPQHHNQNQMVLCDEDDEQMDDEDEEVILIGGPSPFCSAIVSGVVGEANSSFAPSSSSRSPAEVLIEF